MSHNDFRPIPLTAVAGTLAGDRADGFWDGVLHPGDITLLTSQWKTGKTTLLCGLLRHLAGGTPFLDRSTRPAKVWVVSEESASLWGERVKLLPVGPHANLLARPFRGRPTADEWRGLIDAACEARAADDLDVLCVDPLASFLPGRCESDAASLLDALEPLHAFTDCGGAVLLLHHPKKNAAEAGSLARGSGALLGFVDTSAELTRYSHARPDANRRLLSVQSRRLGAGLRLAYEWNPATGAFAVVADPRGRAFEENWEAVRGVLVGRGGAITPREVREFWPDTTRPSLSTLYDWLGRAFERKLVRREGRGTSRDPWRYRLENADDAYYDRNELPPLRWPE